jgi:hypothetical protein
MRWFVADILWYNAGTVSVLLVVLFGSVCVVEWKAAVGKCMLM